MGFYAPAQLIRDARNHGVVVYPADVLKSNWDCSLETVTNNHVLRLGLRLVKNLSYDCVDRVVTARNEHNFDNLQDLIRRAALDQKDIDALTAAGAFASLAGNRHQAYWQALGVEQAAPLFPEDKAPNITPLLPRPSEAQNLIADYASIGLTLGRHPLALLRPRLHRHRLRPIDITLAQPHNSIGRIAGLVIARQRPGSAAGVIFLTLEDETGTANIIVWNSLVERYRKELLNARLIAVSGKLQREREVIHIVANWIKDYTPLLGRLATQSRDFY